MKTYLRAFNLWEVVEMGGEPPVLRANPTIAQMKQHSEEVAKHYKALSCLHSAVTDQIFTKIKACETAKAAWEKLREEFQVSERTRQIQVLNLLREFELLMMKESENIKDYAEKVMGIVSKLRLLNEDLPEIRVVYKTFVSLPEKFEPKLCSIEESKDLSKLSLKELVNALQAVEQRWALRQEESTQGAFLATSRESSITGKKASHNNREIKSSDTRKLGKKGRFPPCPHCKKQNHSENHCWYRPN
ncbi:Uncharacterized protein TCM_030041 [Theobroma cacao]|uniref:Uncharacterized protein n=1 Tax=Theobroma cacao TaxID=3641 RepID=A0A061GN07_THECC|nr:Uncharacterized protein TCM_030041 [Theobroma cacao]